MKKLMSFELHTAGTATIRINRHVFVFSLLLPAEDYNMRVGKGSCYVRAGCVGTPLTNPAIIYDSHLGKRASLDEKRLFARKWQNIRRFRAQDVFPWCERDLEPALFIRLDLDDLPTIGAEYCQNGLIRLIGAFLTLLNDRAHRTDEYLAFDAAVGRCRRG